MHTKTIEWKIDNKIGVWLQLLVSIPLLIFVVFYFFNKNTVPLLMGTASIFLFLGAYNNFKYYKRKYMTYLYLIVGSILLIDFITKVF